jgi:hypothetical protein
MGRLRFGSSAWAVVTISLFLFLPACGGHKPPGASPFPVRISLNPSTSFSLQAGTTLQLSASAANSSNSGITPAFSYASSDSNILDVAPNGFACAGAWNAPLYTICTPASEGVAQVTASALGATSPPTLFFVHPPIDNIQISVVPPVNSPPPACPNQQALPAACNLKFNNTANRCLSQNQVQTLQATAFSRGVDITASVGPFSWNETNNSVVTITPIVTVTSYNVPTNQATVSPSIPGQTQVIASASGAFSQPYNFETCPVQCIALELTVNGVLTGDTSFVVNKGASAETITATAVDVQGCIVPKPPLTWTSSAPAALPVGGATGCAAGSTCTVANSTAGSAAITASCTPPTCNVGFPLNPAGFPAPYVPQPVYPLTAISGLVTGTATSTSVLATSQDCSTDVLCAVGVYNVSTSSTLSGPAFQLPTPPNSLLFDPAGDSAYMGSDFGAVAIIVGNLGSSNNPFTSLPASGTALGLVTGKVLAISHNGAAAIFSDTVSTPNQVYVVRASPPSTTPLNINSATAAVFSPDGLKAFILGNGGNTLYVYSALQSLQPPISLPAPATSIVFNSTGSFALLAGGSSPSSNLAIYNTCDNSAVTLTPPPPPPPGLPGPPLFLKLVPAGNIPLGSLFGGVLIPNLQTAGLDFFFGLDDTGIDIIATNSSPAPITSLCPQQVTLPLPLITTFPPVHINIGQGTFHPINFFLSPDSTRAYIVTTNLGILIYDFNTNSASARITLVNNANPVAADMTVDGSLIYVAGSDNMLHELNTALAVDQYQTSFSPLPNSADSFCFTGTNCALNIVAVKP